MQDLRSVEDIVPKYNFFVLDLWGTLHNGEKFFPETLAFLNLLRQQNKKILFISNSPRQKKYFIEDLKDSSIDLTLYGPNITAGEVFLEEFQKSDLLQRPFYFIGSASLKTELLEKIPEAYFKPMEQAHYILCGSVIEQYPSILKEGIARNLPLVCINPDFYVLEGTQKIPRPGLIAQEYSALGGEVMHYGKPYRKIFEQGFHLLDNPDKKEAIFFGDSLYTDIMGAKHFGVDSVLVNTGVHYMGHSVDPWERATKISKAINVSPTYRLLRLC